MFIAEKSKIYISTVNIDKSTNNSPIAQCDLNIIKEMPVEEVISGLSKKKFYAVSMHTTLKNYSYNQIEKIEENEKENIRMCTLTIEAPNGAKYTIDCEENTKIEFNKITDINNNVMFEPVKFLNKIESVLYNINGELCKIVDKKFYKLAKAKLILPKIKYNNNCFINGILIRGA